MGIRFCCDCVSFRLITGLFTVCGVVLLVWFGFEVSIECWLVLCMVGFDLYLIDFLFVFVMLWFLCC